MEKSHRDSDARVGHEHRRANQPAPGKCPRTRTLPQTVAVQLKEVATSKSAGYESTGVAPFNELAILDQQSPGSTHEIAAAGVAGDGGTLPHLQRIQASFGKHDVSSVQAHVGGVAAQAAAKIGASAYAMGSDVALNESPDLFTTAHEAAHVVQQRGGVQLKGNTGQAGDVYERHADAVADLVVQGKNAEALLDAHPSGGTTKAIQKAPPTGGLVPEPPATSAPKPKPEGDGGSLIEAAMMKAIPSQDFAVTKELKYLKVGGSLGISFKKPSSPEDQARLRNTFINHKASVTKAVGGSVGTAFSAALLKSNLALGDLSPLGFPNVKVELEQTVLEGSVAQNGDKDLALVTLAGSAKGKIPASKIAQFTGVPEALIQFLDVTLSLQIVISLSAGDAMRFVEMRRKAQQLTKHTKELKGVATEAKRLGKEIAQTKSKLRALRKKGTPKQIKKLRSQLAKAQRALKANKARSKALGKVIKSTTDAVVKLSKSMKTPIGKVAGKMFLKTTGKALAKFIPIAGQVLAVAEVVLLVHQICTAIDKEDEGTAGDGEGGGGTGGTGETGGTGDTDASDGDGGGDGGGDGDGDGAAPDEGSTEASDDGGEGGPGFECVEGPEIQRPEGMPIREDEFPSCELPDPTMPLDGTVPEKIELRAATIHLAATLAKLGVKTKFDEDAMLNINDLLPANVTKADIDEFAQRIRDGVEGKPSGDSYDIIADAIGGVKRVRQAKEEPEATPVPKPTNDETDTPTPSNDQDTTGGKESEEDKPQAGKAVAMPMSNWVQFAVAGPDNTVVLNEAHVRKLRDTHGWDKKFLNFGPNSIASKLVDVSLSSTADENWHFVTVTFTVVVKQGDAEVTKNESRTFSFSPTTGESRRVREPKTDALLTRQFLQLSKGKLHFKGGQGTTTLLDGLDVKVLGAKDTIHGDKHHVTFRLKMLSKGVASLRDAHKKMHTLKNGNTIRFVVVISDEDAQNQLQ